MSSAKPYTCTTGVIQGTYGQFPTAEMEPKVALMSIHSEDTELCPNNIVAFMP